MKWSEIGFCIEDIIFMPAKDWGLKAEGSRAQRMS